MSTTLKIVNNDIQISSATGKPILVSDRQKLSQDILMSLETDIRSNGIGTGIASLIGVVSDDDDLMSVILNRRLTNNFSAMRQIQYQTPTIVQRPKSERIASIAAINVSRDNDPRNFKYSIDIITDEGLTLRGAGVLNRGS